MKNKINLFTEHFKRVWEFHQTTQLGSLSGRKMRNHVAGYNKTMLFAEKLMQEEEPYLFETDEGTVSQRRKFLSKPIDGLLRKRQSVRYYTEETVSLDLLLDIFGASFGVYRQAMESSIRQRLRAYPSAGAIYPVRHYLFHKADSNKDEWKLYSFSPNQKKFYEVNSLPLSDTDFAAAFKPPENASSIYVQTIFWGYIVDKYWERGYRLSLLEAGAAMQNLMLVCEAAELNTLAWGGLNEKQVDSLLGCDGYVETTVNSVIIGHGKKFSEISKE